MASIFIFHSLPSVRPVGAARIAIAHCTARLPCHWTASGTTDTAVLRVAEETQSVSGSDSVIQLCSGVSEWW